MLRRAVVGSLVCCFACSGEQRLGEKPRAPLLAIEKERGDGSPARYRYHPNKSARLEADIELGNGSRLFVGGNGERWLYDANQQRVTPASVLAPEALVAIQRNTEARWIFVGESGAGYESTEPLGPFVRAASPLTPLVKVTASERTILGIDPQGALFVSQNAGASWDGVGPRGTRFADVILTPEGKGIALEAPERAWQTVDQGQSWQALPASPLGITGFAHGARGVLLHSALGTLSWNPQASSPFVPAASSDEAIELPVPPAPAPSAQALLSGHARVIDQSYFQVVRADQDTQAVATTTWRLLHGPIDTDLKSSELPLAKGCSDLKLAGFEQWLYLACARPEDPQLPARAVVETEFLRSADGGKTWQRTPYTARSLWVSLKLAVGAGGQLVVTGPCPSPAEPGCQPSGIQYAAAGSSSRSGLATSVVPALITPVDALTFSNDGRTVYGIGRRTKNDTVVVFVSRDQGQHFKAHEVEGLLSSHGAEDSSGVQAISAGSDGSISVVLRTAGDEQRLLLLDEDGRVLALSAPPISGVAIGASGSHALAVSKDGSDIWESLNGGASWERIGKLPAVVCEPGKGPSLSCSVDVYCHPWGCEISDSLSRLGWRGQSENTAAPLPPPEAATGTARQAVKTSIACSYASPSFKPIPGLGRLPSADQAVLGGYAWFAVAHDPSTGAVVSLHARGGKLAEIERVELLAPIAEPQGFAYSASLQVEGGAALRYRATPAHNGRIGNVEIAWDDLVHGVLVHTRLPDGGSYRAGDADRNGELLQIAHPDLISIAEGGLYLRVHRGSTTNQATYFLEPNRITTLPEITWPAGVTGGRQEIVRVAGADVPIRVFDSSAVVRASWQDGHWQFSAETSGWPDPARFGLDQTLDLTYLKGHAALTLTWLNPRTLQGEAYTLPLSATGSLFGTRIGAPTQADLKAIPERCGTAERNATARIVSPEAAGMRHPVVISSPGEPIRVLLTERAVLHGTHEHACADAFDAEGVASDLSVDNQNERAILPLDDLEHSWLFRSARNTDKGSDQVEYRMLDCRFDPTLEAPPEVFTARGTLIAR